jgi:hypothetical protein
VEVVKFGIVVGLGRRAEVGVVGAVERLMRGGVVMTGLKGKDPVVSVKGNVGGSSRMLVRLSLEGLSVVAGTIAGLGASQMMSTRAADAGLGGDV